jgi:hypothetical protein
MREVLPKAKLIVLLRDPVKRAFSHYQHYKSRSQEPRDFAEVVEEALAEPAFAPVLGTTRADSEPLLHYVHRGYYALQLEVLFDHYPREQVLVLDSANLFDNTNMVCQKVFTFLGLDPQDVSPKKIHNRGLYREQIDPSVAETLREHYRPHDELLSELLERRFRWMDEPSATPVEGRSAA